MFHTQDNSTVREIMPDNRDVSILSQCESRCMVTPWSTGVSRVIIQAGLVQGFLGYFEAKRKVHVS